MSSEPAAYFFQTPQGNQGPYSHEAVQGFLDQGQVSPEQTIWRQGYDSWMKILDCGEFRLPAGGQSAAGGAPPPPAQNEQDDHLDSVFVRQVKKSWERYQAREESRAIDEVLLGGVITSTLDNGFALIDIASRGHDHYLRFENIGSGARILFKMTHHGESLLHAKVLGHEASVTIGYGERVRDFNKIWTALKQEVKGGYIQNPDPGVVTVDADMSSQYIYVEVGLLWDLDDYLADGKAYSINYPKLTEDIGATVHALRKYLYGRLQG